MPPGRLRKADFEKAMRNLSTRQAIVDRVFNIRHQRATIAELESWVEEWSVRLQEDQGLPAHHRLRPHQRHRIKAKIEGAISRIEHGQEKIRLWEVEVQTYLGLLKKVPARPAWRAPFRFLADLLKRGDQCTR